jgi:S1-C subfamily serine protease
MLFMSDTTLTSISNQLADVVAAVGPSVVQVQGRRRPASGTVFGPDVVLTTARAVGREDGLHVRTPDGRVIESELAGWDPVTHLAVLRAPGLGVQPASPAEAQARVGHLAVAVARSWSNAVTASAGLVAIIGGPLPTGRGRAIAEVIRTTAPMHDGFAGGAFVDTTGRVIGIATAVSIRDLGVVIPAAIAWQAAKNIVEHGHLKRGYLGLAGQAVRLASGQRAPDAREQALLVVGVSSDSPADQAGLLVGDVILSFDDRAIETPEQLLEALAGERIGKPALVRILRGGASQDLTITVGERPAR